jgi:hypothetical protein
MAGQLENITKLALTEMIQSHAKESKFGYVLSSDGFDDLVDKLYEFFETSRSLKTAGDRYISGGTSSQSRMPTSRIPR